MTRLDQKHLGSLDICTKLLPKIKPTKNLPILARASTNQERMTMSNHPPKNRRHTPSIPQPTSRRCRHSNCFFSNTTNQDIAIVAPHSLQSVTWHSSQRWSPLIRHRCQATSARFQQLSENDRPALRSCLHASSPVCWQCLSPCSLRQQAFWPLWQSLKNRRNCQIHFNTSASSRD